MVLYVVIGILWLLVALALYVGRTYERGSPPMYSVYGVGRWFTPREYEFLVLSPAALGTVFTLLAVRHVWRSKLGQ